MNIAKFYWDLNEKALKETKAILKNPRHPQFPAKMVVLLSRCDNPGELFSLFSKRQFLDFWPKVKTHWVKITRQSDFRDWWQTIYEQLLQRYKKEHRGPAGEAPVLSLRIGRVIKEARLQKGLSQTDLARLAGIKQPDISKIEEGKKNITLKTLSLLSGALKIKKLSLS